MEAILSLKLSSTRRDTFTVRLLWAAQGLVTLRYPCGVVYELTQSDGSWSESVLYSFTGGNDGGAPAAGLIFDSNGNLYGTTTVGGVYNKGTVFQLTPAGSGWTENVLYSFQGSDGFQPAGGLIFDAVGQPLRHHGEWRRRR